MRKNIAFFIVGGLAGFVAGTAAMLVAFPFLFPPPALSESVAADKATLLVSGAFRPDADGQDAAHWGKGDVKVYRGEDGNILLELQPGFEVGPGPNFWLYFNSVADINNEKDFEKDAERVKLAKLKSFSGSQVYSVPAAEYQTAKALTIWCESFNQYIASANL